MSCKRKLDVNLPAKRVHNTHTFEIKMQILQRIQNGEKHSAIARSMGISRSTVTTISRNKEKITKFVTSTGRLQSTMVGPKRGVLVEKMENYLKIWLNDQVAKSNPVTQAIISSKAKSIYDELRKQEGECLKNEPPFVASNGWFDRFKKRINLHISKLNSSATDLEKYCKELSVIAIKTEKFDPEYNYESGNYSVIHCGLEKTDDQFPIEGKVISSNVDIKTLGSICKKAEDLINLIMKKDPDGERSARVCQNIWQNLACYKNMYENQPESKDALNED